MKPLVRLTLMLFACGVFESHSAAEPEALRTLTVNVTVQDHQGVPIQGVGFAVMSNGQHVGLPNPSSTDLNGQATLGASVSMSCAAVELVPGPGVPNSRRPSEMLAANQGYIELKRKHSFQSKYTVLLDPATEQYSLTIATKPGIVVIGRLVDLQGVPIASGGVLARDCQCFASSKREGLDIGTFELVGLPRGEVLQLRVSGNGKLARLVRLSAEQTQSDIDLGDIALGIIAGASKARLQLPPEHAVRPDSVAMHTVVSEDGETIITIVVDNSDGRPRTPWLDPEQGWLPPGRYYVLPNSIGFGGDEAGWQLLDLIRAGRAGAHPELPSFVAVAGQEVSITIDPKETARKIRAAAEAELTPP